MNEVISLLNNKLSKDDYIEILNKSINREKSIIEKSKKDHDKLRSNHRISLVEKEIEYINKGGDYKNNTLFEDIHKNDNKGKKQSNIKKQSEVIE